MAKNYLLPPDAIENLEQLEAIYIKKKEEQHQQVDLSKPKSKMSMPVALGGTDVKSRARQIHFIEKMLVLLKANLHPEELLLSVGNIDDTAASDQLTAKVIMSSHTQLIACKIAVTACLFVREEIKKSYRCLSQTRAALHQVIDDILKIDSDNPMDQDTIESCCHDAHYFLSLPAALAQANASLTQAGYTAFSEEEWHSFLAFTKHHAKQHQKEETLKTWPFTSIAQPLFGYTVSAAGAAVGVVCADMISPGSPFFSGKQYIANAIGSGIIWFGIGSSVGPMFVAPIIAGKLIDTFLQIFLARSLYSASEMIGRGAGAVVGYPLDMAYQFVCYAYNRVLRYKKEESQLTGICLLNGNPVIDGKALNPQFIHQSNLLPEEQTKAFFNQTREKGDTSEGMNLQDLKKVIQELQEKIGEAEQKAKMESKPAEMSPSI